MRAYYKCLVIAFGVTIFSWFNTPFCFAKTYAWKDFTKPYRLKMSGIFMGETCDVEVHLPDAIKHYEKIPLIITAYRADLSRSTDYFTVNEQSVWSAYNIKIPSGRKTEMRVDIKTKHLKAGLNVLHFKSRAASVQSSYEINELRFDLRDMDIIKAGIAAEASQQETSYANNLRQDENKQESEPEPIPEDDKALNEAKKLDSSFNKKTRKYLQHALKHLGYYHGKVDGAFGPKTRQAIKAYQRKQGDTPTGYIKRERLEKLLEIGKSASIPSKTEKSKNKSQKHPIAKEKETAQSNTSSPSKKKASKLDENETNIKIENDFLFLVDGYCNPQIRNAKKYSWYSKPEDIQMGEQTGYWKPPRSYQRMCIPDAAYLNQYLSKEEFSVYAMGSEIDIYFFNNQLYGIDFKLDYSPKHYLNVSWGQKSIPGKLLKKIINRFGSGEESDQHDYELHWDTDEVNLFIMKGQGTCNYVLAARHKQLSKEISALADKRKKEKIAGQKKFNNKAGFDAEQAL